MPFSISDFEYFTFILYIGLVSAIISCTLHFELSSYLQLSSGTDFAVDCLLNLSTQSDLSLSLAKVHSLLSIGDFKSLLNTLDSDFIDFSLLEKRETSDKERVFTPLYIQVVTLFSEPFVCMWTLIEKSFLMAVLDTAIGDAPFHDNKNLMNRNKANNATPLFSVGKRHDFNQESNKIDTESPFELNDSDSIKAFKTPSTSSRTPHVPSYTDNNHGYGDNSDYSVSTNTKENRSKSSHQINDWLSHFGRRKLFGNVVNCLLQFRATTAMFTAVFTSFIDCGVEKLQLSSANQFKGEESYLEGKGANHIGLRERRANTRGDLGFNIGNNQLDQAIGTLGSMRAISDRLDGLMERLLLPSNLWRGLEEGVEMKSQFFDGNSDRFPSSLLSHLNNNLVNCNDKYFESLSSNLNSPLSLSTTSIKLKLGYYVSVVTLDENYSRADSLVTTKSAVTLNVIYQNTMVSRLLSYSLDTFLHHSSTSANDIAQSVSNPIPVPVLHRPSLSETPPPISTINGNQSHHHHYSSNSQPHHRYLHTPVTVVVNTQMETTESKLLSQNMTQPYVHSDFLIVSLAKSIQASILSYPTLAIWSLHKLLELWCILHENIEYVVLIREQLLILSISHTIAYLLSIQDSEFVDIVILPLLSHPNGITPFIYLIENIGMLPRIKHFWQWAKPDKTTSLLSISEASVAVVESTNYPVVDSNLNDNDTNILDKILPLIIVRCGLIIIEEVHSKFNTIRSEGNSEMLQYIKRHPIVTNLNILRNECDFKMWQHSFNLFMNCEKSAKNIIRGDTIVSQLLMSTFMQRLVTCLVICL